MIEPSSVRSRRRRFAAWLRTTRLATATAAVMAIALVAWGVGQVWLDRWWVTGLCLYLPSPVLAIGLLSTAAWSWWRGQRRIAVLGFVATLAVGGWTVTIENHFARPTPALPEAAVSPEAAVPPEAEADRTQRSLRLLHWNIWSARRGWDSVRGVIDSFGPDVIALSELPKDDDGVGVPVPPWPGYSIVQFDRLAILVRGEVEAERTILRSPRGKIHAVDVRVGEGGRRWTVHLVDYPSKPSIHRDPALQHWAEIVARERPDVVVGDFNAPRRSRAFTELPDGFAHAYESVGAGWSYTWPLPCPVYAIDHCFHGPRVRPLAYELHSTTLSDHRLQVFDFSWSAN